jgi:diaminohydroxyphosphoribosylaminopyrimidine deaminase/5-amino-6-(5-phosphoribosylamino)uracil reductase
MTAVSEAQAMSRALLLARRGPPTENPRVGCVVLDRDGVVAGEGWHEGAGTAHAESVALAAAGHRARDGTAVVTLEPCAHHGRTGPCVQTLIDAAVGRVVYGLAEPNPVASGGAALLTSVGIDVAQIDDPTLRAGAVDLVRHWAFAVRTGRPFVTWKFAATLDGRSAARDGSSQWITGPAARADVHGLRAECDTVLVGTGTVLADDPQLTVRDSAGQPPIRQPTRAVMGLRDLPPHARVLADTSPVVLLRTRDPVDAVGILWDRGARHVLLEGGPTLAAAFVAAGLVDEVIAYVAPAVLGAGRPAVGDLGIGSIADAVRFELVDATVVGDDVRLTMRPQPPTG